MGVLCLGYDSLWTYIYIICVYTCCRRISCLCFCFWELEKDRGGKEKQEGENTVGQWAFFGWIFLFLDCSCLDIGLTSQSHQAGCFDITGFEDHGSFCSDFLHRFLAGIFCCCCVVSFCRLYFGLDVLIFIFIVIFCVVHYLGPLDVCKYTICNLFI